MGYFPKLKTYSVEKLTALGNSTQDVLLREKIKDLMTDKLLMLHSPMFYLVDKFMKSDKILREVYARVILIRMKDEEFMFEDSIVDEILSLVSLDDLALYGCDASSLEIRNKCTELLKKLFWDSAVIFEDTSELNRKSARYRRRELVNRKIGL